MNKLLSIGVFCFLASFGLHAEEMGKASGKGQIERLVPSTGDSEFGNFEPSYSYA